MNLNEIRLFRLGLEVLLMLNTRPSKTWAYMETDPNWWAVRMWTMSDRLCPTSWLGHPAQVVKRCAE